MQGEFTARFGQALRHKMNGEYDAALTLLRTIAAEQPNNADVYHEMGLIHSYRVEIDESLAALELAVALNPGSRRFLDDLAKTCTMFGVYSDAARSYERRLRDWPDDNDGGTPSRLRV